MGRTLHRVGNAKSSLQFRFRALLGPIALLEDIFLKKEANEAAYNAVS